MTKFIPDFSRLGSFPYMRGYQGYHEIEWLISCDVARGLLCISIALVVVEHDLPLSISRPNSSGNISERAPFIRFTSYRSIGLLIALTDLLLIVATSVIAGIGYHAVMLGTIGDARCSHSPSHSTATRSQFVLLAQSRLFKPRMAQCLRAVARWRLLAGLLALAGSRVTPQHTLT